MDGGVRESQSTNHASAESKHPSVFKPSNRNASNANSTVATNAKVTDFFPIRRSERKPKTKLASKQWDEIIQMLSGTESKSASPTKENKDLVQKDTSMGIGIKWYDGKGRGIEARKRFSKGDFVVEYAGDLIETTAGAKAREAKYAKDTSKGCYMYYFKHGDKSYW